VSIFDPTDWPLRIERLKPGDCPHLLAVRDACPHRDPLGCRVVELAEGVPWEASSVEMCQREAEHVIALLAHARPPSTGAAS